MNDSIRYIGFILFLALLMTGCAQVPKEAGYSEVEEFVGQRVDYRLHWNQGTEADREVGKAIE
jgi:cobalt-zinc-cadmium efflux system outer membrane protein